jgi:SAM-dependent methyltransferase
MPDAASRFTGLAAGYDSARPAPPPDLTAFLVQWSGVAAPDVVDIGAGTGLSTMVWAGVAAQVAALEPGPDMRSVLTAKVAARPAGPTRFTILDAVAERTGLPDASADIVTASTAMHWFDPVRALPEIRRVLRPGGLLVAYAPAWPPRTDPEADVAFAAFENLVTRLEIERGLRPPDAGDDYAATMRASGQFRYVAELALHSRETGDAGRLMLLARTRGGAAALLRAGATEDEIGLTGLAEIAARRLPRLRPWWWSFNVTIGVC